MIFPLICQRLVNARERERERERESCRLNRISLTDLPLWQMFPFPSLPCTDFSSNVNFIISYLFLL